MMLARAIKEDEAASAYGAKPRWNEADILHFAFRIDNYEHLAVAYGGRCAQAVSAELLRILKAEFAGDGIILSDGRDHLDAIVWDCEGVGGPDFRKRSVGRVQALCQALALTTAARAGEPIHASLSFAWTLLPSADHWPEQVVARDGPTAMMLSAVPFSGRPWSRNAEWGAAYREEMGQAAEMLGAIARDGPILAWQPIRNAARHDVVLYREGLVRAKNGKGRYCDPAVHVAIMERLGLVRAFDQRMVEAVLDELERQPAVALGVNVSAHSAVDDIWWRRAVERLRGRPDVARRLIVEITETAELRPITEASAFVVRMQALGCRVALDDFGVGRLSVRDVAMLAPDIIKVDASFLRRAMASDKDAAVFRHLVGLADNMAAQVIVEGVQTRTDSRFASDAGVVWQQGYLLGEPSIGRCWDGRPCTDERACGLSATSPWSAPHLNRSLPTPAGSARS